MPAFSSRFLAAHRVLLAWTGRLLLVGYFAIATLILAGRYWLLPDIDAHRGKVEQALAQAIGLPVKIAAISAAWPGMFPSLSLDGLQLLDQEGRPALSFDRVEAEVDWSSLWYFELRLHYLQIAAPVLDIRRDAAGRFHVAGLPMQGEGKSGFADWLLKQGRIVVSNARILWHDELRAAPALELQKMHFELRNAGRRHSFGLTAEPPAQVAGSLDLRGHLTGRDPAQLADWQGELYADLEQADLSAWSPWLDLPLKWSRGQGGLRVWLGFANLQPTGVTADLHLADVSLRLREDLPALNLNRLTGRLTARRTAEGYAGEIRQLALSTEEGLELPPTDARLALKTRSQAESGEFSTSGLDIDVLAGLAGRLPLPAEVHARLQAFRPKGRVNDLSLSWQGAPETLQHWQVKGSFADLALAAHRELPGFAGISGRLQGSETSGEVLLDSSNAEIVLPAVFPEPRLKLASLVAEIGWQVQAGHVDLLLRRIAFSNHDATGEASGRYRYTGQGPGEIDLSAKLTNAAGNAVWRYMPLVVNKDARDWLQAGILGGRSDQTSLRLKGPLYEFPFRDGKQGIFQVKGSFRGATLKYAPSWPEITGIDGDLLFEGARMLIRAQRGNILGAELSEVQAEIADLEQHEEILTVKGRAKGPTQRFLEFVEASPVGARIDHFTEPMTATGNGELELKLVLPLRKIERTQVQGRFRLLANQLRVLPELPLLTEAQGEFNFTGDRLQARGLRARVLGTPVTADVQSMSGGIVRIEGGGTLIMQALRKEIGLRAMDHLSGESSWRGSVTVKKPGADILLESALDGISSSLPEPFNKTVLERLPTRIEGHIEPRRDAWKISLGTQAAVNLQQAGESWRGRLSLGAAAVKASGAPPPKGIAVSIGMPRFDLDAWRSMFANGSGTPAGDTLSVPPLVALDVKVAELHVLERNVHDVQLQASRGDSRWRISVDSREAQGQLTWDEAGAGRLTGRLAHLTLPASDAAQPAQTAETKDSPQELPAVDLMIDNFRLREMALGEVRVKAENREGGWSAKLDIKNDAAQLAGSGRWRPSRIAPETHLDFKLDVTDAEKLLVQLGMPDAVRRGSARIEGDVSWSGSPFALDLPSLSGRLKLDAEKGQFKKLEPGVGRLLGVLSLQSLPRRITLDFRDIFSEGFAFDSIGGEARIGRGLMHTSDLGIRGPAAKVKISGQANLVAETQDLRVRVQPAIGESIAVGAMIAHPVAGAVAWAAQKILNDPLDQVFAYEYAVTGSWSDPKVEKVSGTQPAAAPRSGPP